MSKVFVDRELLRDSSAELSDWRMSFPDADSGMTDRLVGEIDAVLAQPAEAEGVGKWSQLKNLAEKATPGPWWVDSHGHRVSTEDGMQTVFIAANKMGPATRHPETGNLSHWPNDWDASYIVNASPDKILELIAALSAVTAERDRLREALGDKALCAAYAERQKPLAEVESMRKVIRAALYYVPEHKHDLREIMSAAMAAKEA